jgi:hypothetical protein
MAALALLFALVVQAAAQPAVQADWRPLGRAGEGRQTLYDAASVERAGAVTRVRLRFNETGPYVLSTIEIRCGAYDGRILGLVNYDANGMEIGRNAMATPFRAIVVGSIIETVAREVCGASQGPAAPQ